MSTSNEYTVNGTSIFSLAYALENLGDDEEKPEPPQPSEQITNAQIIAALESNFRLELLSNCFTFDIDLDCVENGTWYVTTNADNKLTNAEYSFVYKRTDNGAYFTVGKVEFATPISCQDLKDGKIGNVNYTRTYIFDYISTIQIERNLLTNAICDKVFGENESATSFIDDKGNTANDPQLGTARMFTVVQITEDGVKEISINIKTSSNDAEYIGKLSDISNYRTYYEKSYTISGVKVPNNDEPFAAD